jgi:hypothetical protein
MPFTHIVLHLCKAALITIQVIKDWKEVEKKRQGEEHKGKEAIDHRLHRRENNNNRRRKNKKKVNVITLVDRLE